MANNPHKHAEGENPPLPTETTAAADLGIPTQLPILPMRDVALFPGISGPLAVGREASVRLIEDASAGDMLIGLVAQRAPSEDKPHATGLYTIGVAARLHRVQRLPNGTLQVLVQGLQRIKVLEYLQEEPYFRARVQPLEDAVETSKDMENLQVYLIQQFGKLVTHTPLISGELLAALANISSPGMISDIIAGHLNIPLAEKQELLEMVEVKARLASSARL